MTVVEPSGQRGWRTVTRCPPQSRPNWCHRPRRSSRPAPRWRDRGCSLPPGMNCSWGRGKGGDSPDRKGDGCLPQPRKDMVEGLSRSCSCREGGRYSMAKACRMATGLFVRPHPPGNPTTALACRPPGEQRGAARRPRGHSAARGRAPRGDHRSACGRPPPVGPRHARSAARRPPSGRLPPPPTGHPPPITRRLLERGGGAPRAGVWGGGEGGGGA